MKKALIISNSIVYGQIKSWKLWSYVWEFLRVWGKWKCYLQQVTDVEKGALGKGTGFWVLVPAVLSKASKTGCLCMTVGPGGDWPMSCHQPEQLPCYLSC